MEAYLALGENRIPAIIVDANEVERLLRSTIENIARRQQRPLELLQDISTLRDRDIRITRLPTRPGCPLPMSMKSAS